MTPEEINRAIAEFCLDFEDLKSGRSFKHSRNYFEDLNAMHEAEKSLTDDQCDVYGLLITGIMSDGGRSDRRRDYCDWHATAPQRAEAFLRTIGRWKEKELEGV